MLQLLLYHLKHWYHFVKTGLLQGLPAQVATGFPNTKLIITVITGTDGKTTTSTLLYHILKSSGIKVGLISTVAAYIGAAESDTGFHVTSPQPKDMFTFMNKMVKERFTHLVLEATSHGMYQSRTWGITPTFAGLTNISPEHLDYHLSYQEYVKAKMILLKKAGTLFLNQDDTSFNVVKKIYKNLPHKTYSDQDKLSPSLRRAVQERFSEHYNQMNARLAIKIAQEHGVSDAEIARAITTFPGVPGRMEVVTKKPVEVIVDFAHTPQGLSAVLTALKDKKPRNKNLVAVFGCAGLRDRSKRPAMGKIASELADVAIFTAEDPRTEDVWSIIRQMKEGVTQFEKVLSIPDRYQAIDFAITKVAKPGDIVAVLGKGHEQSMCFGTTEVEWSDTKAIQQITSTEKK